MKITPIAFDSLGTRSMATFVKTRDCRIVIDPGVALGPLRYGLPPHPLEVERMGEHWEAIKEYANRAEILIVTHYHYDHHDPEESELYEDKVVLIKHPTERINLSQKGRAEHFLKRLNTLPSKLEYCDGREFSFGDTRIRFSKPVFHGTNSRLGYVTEVSVREGDFCFVHTSDVEGPSVKEQASFILNERPNVIFVDGPMSYMLGYRYSYASLQKSIENLNKIIGGTPVQTLVLDHHLLRDLKWRKKMVKVIEAGKKEKVDVLTAAEFLGQENDLLEARRKELHEYGI